MCQRQCVLQSLQCVLHNLPRRPCRINKWWEGRISHHAVGAMPVAKSATDAVAVQAGIRTVCDLMSRAGARGNRRCRCCLEDACVWCPWSPSSSCFSSSSPCPSQRQMLLRRTRTTVQAYAVTERARARLACFSPLQLSTCMALDHLPALHARSDMLKVWGKINVPCHRD